MLTTSDRTEYEEWRRGAIDALPDLASKIFALRAKYYPGCGLQESFEGRFGRLMWDIQTPSAYPQDKWHAISIRTKMGVLKGDVERAEKSVDNYIKP